MFVEVIAVMIIQQIMQQWNIKLQSIDYTDINTEYIFVSFYIDKGLYFNRLVD